MNKQPVYYMQTDSRWRYKDYSTKGESTTIGASGCGPTCAAMLIETLTGKKFTPVDACAWSLQRGYKALKSGTYYSYFVPQFKAFGIKCEQLNYTNIYGNSTTSVHDKAFKMLKEGYYLIACMGKGNWTSSGHYIVVWWEDGKVRINDPASTKSNRLNGDLTTFKSQVKYYWAIDAQEYNNPKPKQEEDDMTEAEVRKIVLDILIGMDTTPDESLKAEWEEAKKLGITDGSRPGGYAKREHLGAMIVRAMKKLTQE